MLWTKGVNFLPSFSFLKRFFQTVTRRPAISLPDLNKQMSGPNGLPSQTDPKGKRRVVKLCLKLGVKEKDCEE